MANDFMDSGDYTPPTAHTGGRSATLASLAQAVENGFNLLPDKLLIHQDRVTYAADTGAVNAYLIALPETLVAYTTGLRVVMKTANANTAASTINVDSIGVKNIKRADGSDLEANDIAAGQMVMLGYDGTNFQVLNGAGANADVSIHAALTATHGATGAVVGTTNTQTLTNKTISGGILTGITTLPGSGQISANGRLGLGMTPVNEIDISGSADGPVIASVLNSSAGTLAYTGLKATNGTYQFASYQLGTGWTTSGVERQNGGLLEATGPGGVTIHAKHASGVIYGAINSAEVWRFDSNTSAGNTRFMIYDVDNGTVERVSVGAPDSGGVGFKLLRIPN